jgi:hypothetical protein
MHQWIVHFPPTTVKHKKPLLVCSSTTVSLILASEMFISQVYLCMFFMFIQEIHCKTFEDRDVLQMQLEVVRFVRPCTLFLYDLDVQVRMLNQSQGKFARSFQVWYSQTLFSTVNLHLSKSKIRILPNLLLLLSSSF